MKEYIVILILILILYLLFKKNIHKNTPSYENFAQSVKKRYYTNEDITEIKLTYKDWLSNNEDYLKTFKVPVPYEKHYLENIEHQNMDSHIYQKMNTIYQSELFNQLNTIETKPKISSFIAYTKPSATLNLSFTTKNKFNTKEPESDKLFIKYIIKTKEGKELYTNYICYPNKIKDHKHIEKNYLQKIVDNINNNKKNNTKLDDSNLELAFERPNNLDGLEGYNQNELKDNRPVYSVNRELYLYEGSYNIEVQFISSNENLLKEINTDLILNIRNEELKLNESIENISHKKSNTITDNENIKTVDNYFGKLFLDYTLEPVKERLRLGEPKKEDTYETNRVNEEVYKDLIISNNKDHYNYYKLVIINLIYMYDIYLELNGEKKLGLDEFKEELKVYFRDLMINKVDHPKGRPMTEEEKKSFITDFGISLNLEKPDVRDKEYDKILNNVTINDINKKNIDVKNEEYLPIIEKLLNLLDSIENKEPNNNNNLKYLKTNLHFDYVFNAYKPEKPKTFGLLGGLSPAEYVINIVNLIKNDFKRIFGKERTYLEKDFKELLSDDLKNKLEFLNTYSDLFIKENQKGENDPVNANYKEYKIINKIKIIIEDFIEQINNAKLNTLQELANLDIKDYIFGKSIIIDNIAGNPIYSEHFTNTDRTEVSEGTEVSEDIKGIQVLMNKLKDIKTQREDVNNRLKNLKNGKSNEKKKSDNTIETFTNMNFHKHTSTGQVKFGKNLDIDNEDWYSKPENKSLITDYSFIDPDNKSDIMNSLDSIENNIIDSNVTIKSLVDSYAAFNPHTMNNKVETSIELAENDLNKAVNDTDVLQYKNKEEHQERKMKDINDKIIQLEKIQNKIYYDNKDHYKSIQSFGDGQVLSIENRGQHDYSILVNNKCLEYDKTNGINNNRCEKVNKQMFNINNVNNNEEYNKILEKNKKPLVTEYSNIKYPFQIVQAKNNKDNCLMLDGNSVGVTDCTDSKFQRWEAFKQNKDCDDVSF
jgi:hypothetical protein